MNECHATNLNRRLPAFDHMTAVALAEMDLALGRPGRALRQLAEALGRIWAYSRRQQSWFRKLGASRIDRRSAVSGENHRAASAGTPPELEITLAQDRTTIYHADGK
jgi:hypothetical protein